MIHALPVLGTLDEVRTGKAVPYIQGGGDGGDTTSILLGTGTSITQAAMRELAKAGVLVGTCAP